MTKGGKRQGAGRPRGKKLRLMDRARVGACCERLWREEVEKKGEGVLIDVTKELQRLHSQAQSIPVSDRKQWLASEAYEDHSAEVRELLLIMHNLLDSNGSDEQLYELSELDTPCVVQIPLKRPQGVRKEIRKAVASKYGITERMTQTCWDEFRALERQSSREIDKPDQE